MTPSKTIDCDIHIDPTSLDLLQPYLTDHWCDYINESAFIGPDAHDYPAGSPLTGTHRSAAPVAERSPAEQVGDRLHQISQALLPKHSSELGILNCCYWVQSVHHPDLAAALATAINQWQIEHWLEKDDRLRASLVVPSQLPEMAAKEIERFGSHPGFIQVLLPVRSDAPYGNRRYHPIYAAAVRHSLAVGIHYGGAAGHPPTPAGWPSTFLEEYVDMAQLFQSQVMSLIIEGAFADFPQLRVALIEGGFTWIPSLMWRMDKEWKGLRHNIPWVQQPPSALMREHIRLTTSPLDAPPTPEQLQQIIDQMDSDSMLMFSSDDPHHHADEPLAILGAGLPDDLTEKIGWRNAQAFYNL